MVIPKHALPDTTAKRAGRAHVLPEKTDSELSMATTMMASGRQPRPRAATSVLPRAIPHSACWLSITCHSGLLGAALCLAR